MLLPPISNYDLVCIVIAVIYGFVIIAKKK